MKHKLVTIGYIRRQRCYLDVPREDAMRRYQESTGEDAHNVNEFEFVDEFSACDAFPAPMKVWDFK